MNTLSHFLVAPVKVDAFQRLKNLVRQWDSSDACFDDLESWLASSSELLSDPIALEQIRTLFSPQFLNNTMQGFGIRKPFGYSGDFKIIDMIYTHHHSEIPEFYAWDSFFHKQAAPNAVRNRKEYFKKLISDKMHAGSMDLLNVASGPARDLQELYAQLPDPSQLRTQCVELDPHAIEYASQLCQTYLQHIAFHQKNILRFQTQDRFDVVWSAGLFDYFEDRIFILALKKFATFVKPGGEIVIGNFSLENPSKNYMELLGDWYLIHRSPETLTRLALDAGFEAHQISIRSENLGVNLFMHIQM